MSINMNKKEEEYNKNKIPHPFELFGIECNIGWKKLLKPLFDYITDYNNGKNEEEKIKVLQVKEKFGGLRFYTNFGTKELYDMIDEAEEKSYNICELCGSENEVGMRENEWFTTTCLECVKEMAKKSNMPQRWRRNTDSKLFRILPNGSMEEIEEGNV